MLIDIAADIGCADSNIDKMCILLSLICDFFVVFGLGDNLG